MLARLAVAAVFGSAVTLSLLFIMQSLLHSGRGELDSVRRIAIDDFVRIERPQVVETQRAKPPKPSMPEEPPQMSQPDLGEPMDNRLAVALASPQVDGRINGPAVGFATADGDFLPIVKVAPVYPNRALAKRLEGYVLVEFTITQAGTVKDVIVVESTAPVFEASAIEAALKFKYKPRIAAGQAIEVRGVRNKIVFELAV